MSQENIDLVRRSYELWAARDLDGLLELTDPDVEIHSLLTEAETTSYRGHQGVREWFEALLGVFPDWNGKIEGIRATGDAVVMEVQVDARAVGSGAPVDQTTWQAARIRAGKLVFVGWFRTRAEALEAAGLRE
jgi:ketosteroid isomerase-like protein